MGTGVFDNAASGFTVYFYSGSTGFTTPTWQGYPSVSLDLGSITPWRLQHFGTVNATGSAADNADPDGDGQSNAAEFAAGTDPLNPADAFKILSSTRGANTFNLQVSGKAGKTYTLERSVDLNSWAAVSGATSSNGFYRVSVSQP